MENHQGKKLRTSRTALFSRIQHRIKLLSDAISTPEKLERLRLLDKELLANHFVTCQHDIVETITDQVRTLKFTRKRLKRCRKVDFLVGNSDIYLLVSSREFVRQVRR